MAPLAPRELNGKRKRERIVEEELDERKEEEENMCPNGGPEKTTPVRKVRGQTKGSQKLFTSGGETNKTKGGETSMTFQIRSCFMDALSC